MHCRLRSTRDCDFVHANGLHWPLVYSPSFRNFDDDVKPLRDHAEDWMLGGARCEPIEEMIVCDIHKKLAAAGIRLADVSHGERTRKITVKGTMLVLDRTAVGAAKQSAILQILKRCHWRTALTCPRGARVPRERTAELIHEAIDDAMEVEPVVEAAPAEIYEVGGRDGDTVKVDFGLEAPFRGFEMRNGIDRKSVV